MRARWAARRGERWPVCFLAMLVALAAPLMTHAASAQSAMSGPPEIRAVWVDAFHAGIRSPDEVAQLVADAKRLHLNTLIVQVRRRGDALYIGGLEPPLDDPNYAASFDALSHVIDKAHAADLQVHAWINAMPVWRDETPPRDARHLFNMHGPSAAGEANWLTSNRAGVQRFPVGYFLDPGHPDVQQHLVSVYLDIVRRYAVDGIHFDYIRYPETDGPALPRGSDVGYNPMSVARFNRATGRVGLPAPEDDAWIRWRRQQVTQLMRRISVEARAINSRIKVSAATIAWGAPPGSLAAFERAAPMQRVFQNWQAWLSEGILDLAVPMNYAREHDERVRGWFDGWIAWEKRHKAGRQLAVGIGGYLSAPEGVLAQVKRVRTPNGRARADGMSFFSYFSPSLAATGPDRLGFLIAGANGGPPAFEASVPVPPMPWIENPTGGFIAGRAADGDGTPLDGASVLVRRTGWFRRTLRAPTDANGWFGLMRLKPGKYRVRLDGDDRRRSGATVEIVVTAGAVSRVHVGGRTVAQ